MGIDIITTDIPSKPRSKRQDYYLYEGQGTGGNRSVNIGKSGSSDYINCGGDILDGDYSMYTEDGASLNLEINVPVNFIDSNDNILSSMTYRGSSLLEFGKSHLVPAVSGQFDLGTSQKKWREMYGNAETASQWIKPVKLELTGAIIGAAEIDGSRDIKIETIGGSGSAGKWWGQDADERGEVKGLLSGADGIVPSERSVFNIGTNTLRYNQVFANVGDFLGNVYTGDLSPQLNLSYNIGLPQRRFNNTYVKRIDVGNSGFQSITQNIVGISIRGNMCDINFIGGELIDDDGIKHERKGGVISWKYNGEERNPTSCLQEIDYGTLHLFDRLYIGRQLSDGDYSGPATTMTDRNIRLYADRIGCVSVTQDSDKRIKENIEAIEEVSLENIGAYKYNLKETGEKKIGVIAQELKDLYPEIVNEGISGMLGVDYAGLTTLLLAEVKQLRKTVNKLEVRINEF